MTPITLEHCPIRWLRYSRKLKCQHPDAWSELTPKQLLAAVRVMQETISDNELIATMLSIKPNLARRLSPYQKFCIVDLLGFLIDNIAQQAKTFIQDEITTVEKLLNDAPDQQKKIEEVISELKTITAISPKEE